MYLTKHIGDVSPENEYDTEVAVLIIVLLIFKVLIRVHISLLVIACFFWRH
jgi:hypothetical protein